jgi:hypothetical protein
MRLKRNFAPVSRRSRYRFFDLTHGIKVEKKKKKCRAPSAKIVFYCFVANAEGEISQKREFKILLMKILLFYSCKVNLINLLMWVAAADSRSHFLL